ncbi:hypothetical protein R3X27_23560 [Tropicimonas sp. TH_r6]|uniref:hypothetical protein n=1 Tax=Tropicimonas sp. TH_r6 TaxID=3082085 RepID=UPI0029551D6D|nr:hypothetical protein [Tropicimonas sp. TH_r6]MDV7145672.1 hypothetical protein [Tropicimonas sp. TH_r6]
MDLQAARPHGFETTSRAWSKEQPAMPMSQPTRLIVFASTFALGAALDPLPSQWSGDGAISSAKAEIGRPLTPGSAAGVKRRVERRTIRQIGNAVPTPAGQCSIVLVDGVQLHKCGETYYQEVNGQYFVVVIE